MFALTRRVTHTVFCFWQGISPAPTVLPTEGLSGTDSPLPVRGSSTDPGMILILSAKALKSFIRETSFNNLCRYGVECFPVICSVCLILTILTDCMYCHVFTCPAYVFLLNSPDKDIDPDINFTSNKRCSKCYSPHSFAHFIDSKQL